MAQARIFRTKFPAVPVVVIVSVDGAEQMEDVPSFGATEVVVVPESTCKTGSAVQLPEQL